MTTIRLTNSKTRKKEDFVPIDDKNVRMYLCGPTVYDRAHLGNARPVIVFDVLNRLLRHVYGQDHVTYVRNFTDVDDKINAEALRRQKAGAPGTLEDLITERTNETIAWYHADMDALGAARPDHEPRATEYIEEMKEMIKELIRKDFAYSTPITYGHNSRAVYFNSEKAPEHSFFNVEQDDSYGQLSGRSLDDMISGAKAEIGEGKRNPMDFVLWKPSKVDEPGWESPWGVGRPGWHIECSAMSKALLGKVFDIHGGGIDLQFPHHENEIAQSCCANDTDRMANFWLHNEMLQVEGKKMSKSLGNFFTVRDLLDQGVPGEVIRFVFLMTHYRSPMDWTDKKRQEAEARLDRILPALAVAVAHNLAPSDRFDDLPDLMKFALTDDLNTSGAIVGLESSAQALMQLVSGEVVSSRGSLAHEIQTEALKFLSALEVLGLYGLMLKRYSERKGARHLLDPVHLRFTYTYELAKNTKDFSAVDALKSALIAAGVEVRMSKAGVELVPGPDFDPAKLEALK